MACLADACLQPPPTAYHCRRRHCYCRAEGYYVILLNSNPATIMTDPGTADRTYVGPMTPDLVEQILAKVCVCVLCVEGGGGGEGTVWCGRCGC